MLPFRPRACGQAHRHRPAQAGRGAVAARHPLHAGEAPAGIVELVFAGRRRSASRSNASRRGSPTLGGAWQRRLAPGAQGLRRAGEWRSGCDQLDPGFERASPALLATKREVSADVDATVRAIIAACARRGRRRAASTTRQHFDRVDLAAVGTAGRRRRDRGGATRRRPEAVAALALAARPHPRRTTRGSGRRTTATPTRWASSSARAGRRSRRSASMCRAAPPAIRARC